MKELIDAGITPAAASSIVEGVRASIENEIKLSARRMEKVKDVNELVWIEPTDDRFLLVTLRQSRHEIMTVNGMKALQQMSRGRWKEKFDWVRSMLIVDLSQTFRLALMRLESG